MTKLTTKSYIIAIATALAGLGSVAPAATIYWNAGSGSWDISAQNWSTDPDGNTASAWVDSSDAVFSSSAVTVTPSITLSSASVNVNSLLFNTSTTITQSTNKNIVLANTGSNTVTVADGQTVSLSGTLSASTSAHINLGTNSVLSIGFIGNTTSNVTFNGGKSIIGNIDSSAVVNSGLVIVNGNTTGKLKGLTINGGTLILNGIMAGTSRNVSVAAGATYGGVTAGTNGGKVTLAGKTAILSPGNVNGTTGASQVGTLVLNSLTASNGGTFNIDIDGSNIDLISLGANAMTLGGELIFNFTNLGTVNTGTAYTIFTGTGTWTATGVTFNFATLPDGYKLDTSYGNGNGYVLDTTSATRTLTVQFATVPEVASLGILGLGALAVLARKPRR